VQCNFHLGQEVYSLVLELVVHNLVLEGPFEFLLAHSLVWGENSLALVLVLGKWAFWLAVVLVEHILGVEHYIVVLVDHNYSEVFFAVVAY